jgi:microcystin degradation protein MlrC
MFKSLSIAILISLGLLSGGLIQPPMVNADALQITIAIVDLEQETNIFSPVKTTLEDFKLRDLHYGAEILTNSAIEKDQIAGFMAAVKEFGGGKVEVVPVIQAKAMSGGPVEKAVYERFKKEIMDGLHAIKKIDGIYLDLHGAMGVEGLIDPEGDILEAIRKEYGKDLPIGTSYDLHANMTEKKATLATFIVGYKTNPHRDFFATGYSSGKILIKTIQGEIHPTMTVNKMHLLRGGGDNMDFLAPMNGIFDRMKDMEKRPGVLSVSNFMVHIWLDEPELGWSTVAVTDNNKELANTVADEIAGLDWSVRDVKISQKLYTPSGAVKGARDAWLERALGIVMFCDLSDTVGTGSPGENTWLLKALMAEGSDMVSYVPVRDAEVVNSLSDVPLNKTVTVSVGGKLDKVYNKPFEFTGELIYKGPAQDGTKTGGKAVVLRNKGVHLIVTDFPPSTYFPNFFTTLGLDLWKADIVVAKNLFPFRIRFLQYNRKTFNVQSAGTTNIDVSALKYNNITRPIYPLDQVSSWQWKKW